MTSRTLDCIIRYDRTGTDQVLAAVIAALEACTWSLMDALR